MSRINSIKIEDCPIERSETGQVSREIYSLLNYVKSGTFESPLSIDLSQPGFLTTVEIALIACAIREMAESGVNVEVRLPTSTDRSITWTLYAYRLPHVLGFLDPKYEWQRNIKLPGYSEELPKKKSTLEEFKNIVPLHWIDDESFGIDDPAMNLYLVDPQFDSEYLSKLDKLMEERVGMNWEDRDAFIQVVFKEIGWNSVLHSKQKYEHGFGIFCGQLNKQKNSFDFAIVDLGMGIVSTLGKSYKTAVRSGKARNFQEEMSGATWEAAVLRYAFEDGSTGKAEFPAAYERNSERGLSLVADVFEKQGLLVLMSSNAMVSLSSKNVDQLYNAESSSRNFKGTYVFGSLDLSLGGKNNKLISFEEIPANNIFSVSHINESIKHDDLESKLEKIEAHLRPNLLKHFKVAVDFGFTEPNKKFIEELIIRVISNYDVRTIRVSGLRFSNISGAQIANQLLRERSKKSVVVEAVYFGNQLDRFEFARGKLLSEDIGSCVSYEEINEYQYLASSIGMEEAFASDFVSPGCYVGNIHLLNGLIANRYFSIVDYLEESSDYFAHKWVSILVNLLSGFEEYYKESGFKIVGFSASVMRIMTKLFEMKQLKGECIYISSYDFPNHDELSEFIHKDERVVLFTDVISSGTLISNAVGGIRRVGGHISAIACLIDAREKGATSWMGGFGQEGDEIPLLTGCKLERTLTSEINTELESYWVDSVSAVLSRRPVGPILNQVKLDRGLQIIAESDCMRLGHFVEGVRHSSVRIDTHQMFSQLHLIERWTSEEIEKAKRISGWEDFVPEVALVPQGIVRISALSDLRGFNSSESASERYAEIVCEHFENPKIKLIHRTFDPGGKSKCGSIDYLENKYSLDDLLIVDDAFSSGSTIRSLISQAVRYGAKRILVITLMARTTIEELEHWQMVKEMSSDDSAKGALINVIYPIHLPLTFQTKEDCPQCTTLTLLEARGTEFTKPGLKQIKEELNRNSRYAPVENPQLYVQKWLEFHTLSVLAGDSQYYFEKLRNRIYAVLSEAEDDHQLSSAVIVRLFLIEWRLREKARLRQIIAHDLKELCQKNIANPCMHLRYVTEALSLIRSLYPELFFSQVEKCIDRIVGDEEAFERVLFHLESYEQEYWHHRRKQLSERLYKEIQEKQASVSERGLAITRAEELLLSFIESEPRPANSPDKIRYLLEKLTKEIKDSDSSIAHEVIPRFSLFLIKYRNSEFSSSEFWQLLGNNFERALEILRDEIFPYLEGLQQVILQALSAIGLRNELNDDYFNIHSEKTNIAKDIANIVQSLKKYEADSLSMHLLSGAHSSCQRAFRAMFGKEAILIKALEHWTEFDNEAVTANLVDSVRTNFPAAKLTVEATSGLREMDMSSNKVVLTKELYDKFVAIIVENIRKHPLTISKLSENELDIRVSSQIYHEGSVGYLSVSVSNNIQGKVQVRMRKNSVIFDSELKVVGGSFVPCRNASGDDNRVMATLTLRFLD